MSEKFFTKQKVKGIIKKTAIGFIVKTIVFAPFGVAYGCYKSYEHNNSLFHADKVYANLELYGGDSRYVERNYNKMFFGENNLVNHFNSKDNSNIRVGFSTNLDEGQKLEFTKVINYYNELFEIINPNYKLNIIDNVDDISSCDVLIRETPLDNASGNFRSRYNRINRSQLSSGTISIDDEDQSPTMQRFVLAHELMHLFYGSSDIDYTQSTTFSVYNYNDVGFMIDQIENNYSSEKDSFISLTPIDVSTLIAIYGDSSNPENVKKYIDLLNTTLKNCSRVFGEYQPYYEVDFSLPSIENVDDLEIS